MNKEAEIKEAGPDTLIGALVKAQSEMGAALKKSSNPHFDSKYADLAAVQDACLPALHDHGFAVIQPNGRDDHGMYVDTIFMHTSGESLSNRIYLAVDKNNMQGVGSAITYARRYGLMGLAGIAPEDDDGNAAAKAPPKEAQKPTDEKSEADWFRDELPKMDTIDAINNLLPRAKKAGRDVSAMVVARANELGFDFDPEARKYTAAANATTIDDEIPY